MPMEWQQCFKDNASAECIPEDVLFNSVIAYDLDTGEKKWSTRFFDIVF
jgi:hypothetical protein